MERFEILIQNFLNDGIDIILVTNNKEKFYTIKHLQIFENWFDLWDIIDKNVGQKRRTVDLNNIGSDYLEFDALELYATAAIIENGKLWINNIDSASFEDFNIKNKIEKVKNLIVLLSGQEIYSNIEALKKRWGNIEFSNFIVGPNSPIDEINVLKPKGLTVIVEWPQKIDKINMF